MEYDNEYSSDDAAFDAWIEELNNSTPNELLKLLKDNINEIARIKQDYEIKIDKLEQRNRIIMEVLRENLEGE